MGIAVFGALDDPQVSHVASLAVRRGHQIVHVAPEGWSGDGREPHSIFMTRGRGVRAELGLSDLLEVDAAYVRTAPSPFVTVEARAGLPPVERSAVAELMWHARQRAAAVTALIELLAARKKMVINARNCSPAAALAVIAGIGLRVADSLITDDVDAAREFAKGRRVIVKAVTGEGAAFELDRDRDLKKSPVLLQEVAEGGERVRVLIVGELIASSVVVAAGSDGYRAIEVSPDVLRAIDEARIALGMTLLSVDLVIDPSKPELYVISGVDSQPNYLDVELQTGHEITDALLDALED